MHEESCNRKQLETTALKEQSIIKESYNRKQLETTAPKEQSIIKESSWEEVQQTQDESFHQEE